MSTDELQVGWNPDLDIPTAVGAVPRGVLDPTFVLVSMLDSTPNVSASPSFLGAIAELGLSHAAVGTDVALDWDAVLTLVLEDRLFTGFDEVWLCQTVPSSPKPTGIRITSDVRVTDQDSLEIARWMRSAKCDAGLGDGDGLNFATFEPELVSLWSS